MSQAYITLFTKGSGGVILGADILHGKLLHCAHQDATQNDRVCRNVQAARSAPHDQKDRADDPCAGKTRGAVWQTPATLATCRASRPTKEDGS